MLDACSHDCHDDDHDIVATCIYHYHCQLCREIGAQSSLILLAGYETTSVTLTYCIYLLSKHPQAQKKLLQEINQFKGQPSYEDMDQFPYAAAVLNEALRVLPPASMVARLSQEGAQVTWLTHTDWRGLLRWMCRFVRVALMDMQTCSGCSDDVQSSQGCSDGCAIDSEPYMVHGSPCIGLHHIGSYTTQHGSSDRCQRAGVQQHHCMIQVASHPCHRPTSVCCAAQWTYSVLQLLNAAHCQCASLRPCCCHHCQHHHDDAIESLTQLNWLLGRLSAAARLNLIQPVACKHSLSSARLSDSNAQTANWSISSTQRHPNTRQYIHHASRREVVAGC